MNTTSFKRVIKELQSLKNYYCRGDDAVSVEVKELLDNVLNRVEELRQEHNPWESCLVRDTFLNVLDNFQGGEFKDKFFIECPHKQSFVVYYNSPFLDQNNMWVNRQRELPNLNCNGNIRELGVNSFQFYTLENRPKVINEESKFCVRIELAITPKVKTLVNNRDKGFLQEELEILTHYIMENF